ncbi:protein FAR1-RELATED SEQUENCE 5 [Amborella trichopoda]|uniref:protein FAR1-RELATED SEQUENCE 5 n=1 Tax=Amborella trichopoda TaxID=13333 RepID=UPI0005D3C6C5|nr:protein FAR1-RELATED SEQUENCE 5 [Amborella trichopoda]|eukprot:XP_011629433.1 protein FAR1-RELATED SEQUENCE 5 [Amborella trichopoda]
MGGRQPVTIITDQALVITAAVKTVFSNTNHHYCKWHIMGKFKTHLSHVEYVHPLFLEVFKKCISAYTVEQFEADRFITGIKTTQQSEGFNRYLKMYVTAGTGLQKFMNAIEKLQNKKFTKEKEKDSKDLTSTHVLKTAFLIEEHAAKTYTQKVFRKFQEEVVRSSNCLRKIIEGNDEFAKYKVEDIGGVPIPRTVTFIESGKKCTYTCQFFERVGIPCSYMLKVFNMRNVLKIPSNYILSRWTMDAKKGVKEKCGVNSSIISKFLSFIRRHELYDLVRIVAEPALENDDLFEKLKLGFSKLAEEVNATRESLSNAHAPPTSTRCNAVEDDACGSIRSVDVSPLIHMPE